MKRFGSVVQPLEQLFKYVCQSIIREKHEVQKYNFIVNSQYDTTSQREVVVGTQTHRSKEGRQWLATRTVSENSPVNQTRTKKEKRTEIIKEEGMEQQQSIIGYCEYQCTPEVHCIC